MSVYEKIDNYLEDRLGAKEDKELQHTLKTSKEAGLPDDYAISFLHGRFLQILAQTKSAKRILEVGTLGGYSTTFFGRALLSNKDQDNVRLISCELSPEYAVLARKNIDQAGLSSVAEIRVGAALETLDAMIANKEKAFDLIFIDADKTNNLNYYKRALELAESGTLIIVDNVVMEGDPFDESKLSIPYIKGIREFDDYVTKDERVFTTIIQTVGNKLHDGLSLSIVK